MKLFYREATKADIPALVEMLADDQLGSERENATEPLDPAYYSAFESIQADPNNELIVVESKVESKDKIMGQLQITYIPYLSHTGAWRCLIEAVRIDKTFRGQGLGTQVFEWAIEEARKKKCVIVQLTSNKERTEALRFYESLGFVASHEGFKLKL